MNTGWIKLHKKIQKWEWFQDSRTFHLFMHLILSANHEDKKWHGVDIKRGQLATGLKSLSKDTGISVQSLRTSIKKLKSTGEITVKPTNKYSLVTIVNYEEYQERGGKSTDQSTGNLTNNQQSTNNQLTTTKEYKEIKEDKEDINSGSKKYAFEGKLIKLNQRDYSEWKKRYHAIPDIDAELTHLDEYYAKENAKDWFIRCSNQLNKKHQEYLQKNPQKKTSLKVVEVGSPEWNEQQAELMGLK